MVLPNNLHTLTFGLQLTSFNRADSKIANNIVILVLLTTNHNTISNSLSRSN
nr:MAG TPA: hypothetical protein [Crassvirales sp.]